MLTAECEFSSLKVLVFLCVIENHKYFFLGNFEQVLTHWHIPTCGGHQGLRNDRIQRKFVVEYGILVLSQQNNGIKFTKINQNDGF